MELSVVVPIYNEESNLPVLYNRLDKAVGEISGLNKVEFIFVNDGSKDGSLELIKGYAKRDKRVKYLDFSRNFGHQIAIFAGIENSSGEAVVSIDGDLQDPPELIPGLYAKYREGNDVVYARRKKRKGGSLLKKMAYKTFYRLLSKITSVEIPLDTGDFRLINRKVVNCLKDMPEQEKFLRGQIAWMGFNQDEVIYDRDARASGEPGYTYGKLIKLAIDGITSFSSFPLKVASIMGFVVSFISFLLIGWVVFAKFYNPNYDVQGWYSLMVSVLFIGGVQLISIGVIGEYISRINNNVKKRPLYLVGESNINNKEES